VLGIEARNTGMSLVGRSKASLGLVLLVVLVDLLDVEHGEESAEPVGERDAAVLRRLRDGEADGQGPGKPVGEVHLLDDVLVVALTHEAGQRRKGARGEHVQVG
jgi:hypothetical protein